jgi:hypothetical protein
MEFCGEVISLEQEINTWITKGKQRLRHCTSVNN